MTSSSVYGTRRSAYSKRALTAAKLPSSATHRHDPPAIGSAKDFTGIDVIRGVRAFDQFVTRWDRNVALDTIVGGLRGSTRVSATDAMQAPWFTRFSSDLVESGQLDESFVGLADPTASPPKTLEDLPQEIVDRFAELHEEWQRATMFSSSAQDIVMHLAYQRILGMGPVVIPLVVDQFLREPHDWFWALKVLTQADPASDAKSIEEGAAAWKAWLRDAGYQVA